MAKRKPGASALFSLRARWALFLLTGLAAIAATRPLLGATWTALAATAFAAQLLFLWFDLPLNISMGSGLLLPRFGPGTWLSLLRILALSALVGFLWPPRPPGWLAWLPFCLYLFYILADLADGYAARAASTVTRLGEKLDLDLDSRGLLVATLLALHYGSAGWWYLLVGLARYLFVIATWLHRRAGGRFALQPNKLRRPLAGAQMGFGAALLAPELPAEITLFVSTLTMLPFLGNFLVDWLAGAGRLRPTAGKWIQAAWQRVGAGALLGLRFVLAALLVWRSFGAMADVYFTLDLIFGVILLLGLSGRLAAFVLLVETGFRLQGQALHIHDFAILLVGMCLLYLGAGRYSVSGFREGWIFRYWGARR